MLYDVTEGEYKSGVSVLYDVTESDYKSGVLSAL